MHFKLATALAVCVCLFGATTCAPAATPLPTSATPSPTPCAVAEVGSEGATSTTFTSPVFASPLTELPTPSPGEIATREAAMQHANPGAPTMAAGSATVLPPCPTPTPSAVNRATLPAPQAVPATPTGG